MKIIFTEWKIHQAPISVLHHLYYYTAQYGISVRQFTGRHWKYWEKLPGRLKEVQDTPKKLGKLILELEEISSGSQERLRKRRTQIPQKGVDGKIEPGKWEEKEIIINAQLLSVLAALPRRLISSGFKKTLESKQLPNSLRIVDLEIYGDKGEDTDFVEPDLLLLGNKHLLMVEIKTRGNVSSSRKYPPRQLLNYSRLAYECQKSNDDSLPDKFSHLILVPSDDPKWLEDNSKWVIDSHSNDGKLKVNLNACIKYGRHNSTRNYKSLKPIIENMPIYYRSWDHLSNSFTLAIEEYPDNKNKEHWQKIGQEIRELSDRAGRYK